MTDPLREGLATLLAALDGAGVRYALVGAAARNAWAPPRLTTDLDLAAIADAAEYDAIVRALGGLRYAITRRQLVEPGDSVPAVTIFRNEAAPVPLRQVDVLVAGTPFEVEAVERAVRRRIGEQDVPVVRREHLIVYKLIAWRSRDRGDVLDVLATARAQGVEIDEACVRRWATEWDVVDRWEAALGTTGGD